MSQRYDIIHIDFQANARGANAAIESIRQEAETCNQRVKDLKKQLNDGKRTNMPTDQLDKLQNSLDAAQKKARQFNQAYKQLAKGMRTLDEGIKAFNDGSLATMSAAFQKSVYNAAKLTRLKLDPLSKSYTKDKQELTALMDASQKYYATLQADTQQVIDTINKGGKVSRQAITEELQQQKELLSVLSEKDKGYKHTVQQVATLEYELKKMGGSYDYVRKHITDTKKVSDETLRTMHTELQQTNQAGKVSTQIMRENRQAMKEIRAEQTRRVQSVLGGNLGRQSEGNIRAAIANAKELIQIYGTSSKKAKELSAQIVNAEAYLKTVGVEGARAAKQQADAAKEAADKYKLMQDHMKNIGKLTQSALTETQKFWQEQQQGAERGSKKYKEAERNLKALAAEQQRLNEIALQKSAKNLSRKNLGTLSESELQASIAAAKQLAQSMKPGDQAYKDLVDNIIRAEKYVKEFGMEGQRSNRKAAEQMQSMNDNMAHITKLSDGALEETRKFWEAQMNGADRGSKAYNRFKANMDAVIARQRKLVQSQNFASANKLMGGTKALQVMGEDEIRKAITAAREHQKTLKADSGAYTDWSKAIFTAEEYLKQYGIEADKAKLKEEQLKATMTSRMTTLMNLPDSTLAETKKFWQAQKEGAERTSDEYKQAAANLEKIAQVEQTHKASWGMRVMAKPGNYGDDEIRKAVKAMEELRDAQAHGSKEWNRYNSLVEQGKKYLQEWAQVDSVVKFEGQMQKLTTLSDSALAETKKFWQEQVDGAAKGSSELKQYQANLDKVKQEEAERRQLSNELEVQKLGGNLGQLSEGEIRKAIEAGKQLIQTYNTADPAAQKLAQQIVNAEQHLKQYGLEAERSAAREREAVKKAADERAKANQLMESQLQNSSDLTASALKAQESYWKRLIDDPKTAASSLAQYKDNLDKVHLAQQLMMEDEGNKALDFFRNGTGDASAEEVRTQAEALKKYRDLLPQQTNADVIREINGYLAQTGQAAQGAAGPMMSLRDAFRMGLQGAGNSFKGTPEQLKQAKQVLEETLATTEKGSHRYEQLRRALDGIALEEKRVGGVTKEMQAVLDQPKGRSFNELKMAVEQGRKALNDMKRDTTANQKAFDSLAEKVKAADLEMRNLSGESKGTASQFEKAWGRLKTYVTFYVGAAAALQKVGSTVDDLMELSDKMGEVRKTTGFSADEVGRLSDNLSHLDTRTPITELMDLSAVAGQLGLNTQEDVQGFTEAANEMLVALPEMGQEGATQMMKIAIATGEVKKIQKQMQEGTVQGSSATAVAMEKIGSTIDRLRATTAAAAPPIADFVKRVGAVGAQSGISVDQVAALGATVDSLGMGTEMAGTAIARMIPAIKNHAFDISKTLGITPESLRQLFDTGKGMEAVLMVLEKMRDDGMDAKSIESFLGENGMSGLMKDLDQQGARAGIVFAGLSQNVDLLRQNINTANQAYTEGTAIQQEYDKMNDTTAAKWERLKNKVEEVLVNNSAQSFLGTLIDLLRKLVDFISDDGYIAIGVRGLILLFATFRLNVVGFLKGALAVFPQMVNGIRLIGAQLGIVKMQAAAADATMKKMQWGNLFTAVATAVLYVVYAISNMKSASQAAGEELGKVRLQIDQAENQFERYWGQINKTSASLNRSQAEHRRLDAEVKRLTSSTNKGSRATAVLSNKEKELKESENKVTRASNEHRIAIANMNAIYGKYLGYLLTDRNYALLAADAHEKIALAIEHEMLAKQQEAAINSVVSKNTEGITENFGDLVKRMTSAGIGNSQAVSLATEAQNFLRTQFHYNKRTGGFTYNPWLKTYFQGKGLNINGASAQDIAALWFYFNLKGKTNLDNFTISSIAGVGPKGKDTEVRNGDFRNGWTKIKPIFATSFRGGFASSYLGNTQEVGITQQVFQNDIDTNNKKTNDNNNREFGKHRSIGLKAINVLTNPKSTKAQRSQAYEDIGNSILGMQNTATGKFARGKIKEFLNKLKHTKGVDYNRALATKDNIAKRISQQNSDVTNPDASAIPTTTPSGNTSTYTPPHFDAGETQPNPWGEHQDASSTDWSKMSGDTLVDRRKQMNKFVRALQDDSDVSQVLGEDPALQKAIKSGKVANNADAVIDWYNQQRLAIQKELHKNYLTNTGGWLDPKKKKTKKAKKRSPRKIVNDEISYYLDSLDAYYTDRKSGIEEAQNNGDISEAEAWRRNLQNQQIWQQRRGELQQLYSKKAGGVSGSERNAIYDIIGDRTGETSDMVQANIASTVSFIRQVGTKSVAEMRAIYGDLDLGMEKSFQRMQKAVSDQMSAIKAIVDNERPFNGIIDNLETNITKMGLLQTDLENKRTALEKQGVDRNDKRLVAIDKQEREELPKRLNFLLGEAEHAYEITWDKLAYDMKQNGFGSWLDAILNSEDPDEAKRGMIAQLHSVYDDVQDAVKKESSLVKKQVETTWNDTTLLPNGVSIKNTYQRAIDALGVEDNGVNRANQLINAGTRSERVADSLAIKQLQIQLDMQTHYYNLMRQTGLQRIEDLQRAAKEKEKLGKLEEAERLNMDARHAQMSLDLSLSEEETDLAKIRAELQDKIDESQARLYKHLREWGTLLSSSLQGLFEASNTGAADYYNNLAKMRLTGEGSAGGTYVVIDNAGTKNAKAHYENLDGEDALKRQLEIEQQNAVADEWKKVMDDINKKINDEITDWMNAQLQNQAIDENTKATVENTKALWEIIHGRYQNDVSDINIPRNAEGMAVDKKGNVIYPIKPVDMGTKKNGAIDQINHSLTGPWDDNTDANARKTWTAYNDIVPQDEKGIYRNGEGMATNAGGEVLYPLQPTKAAAGAQTPAQMFWPSDSDQTQENATALWTAYRDASIQAQTDIAEANAELQSEGGSLAPTLPTTEEQTQQMVENIQTVNQAFADSTIQAQQDIADAKAESGNSGEGGLIHADGTPFATRSDPAEMQEVVITAPYHAAAEASTEATEKIVQNNKKQAQSAVDTDNKIKTSSKNTYSAMASAMNMYGIAYQAMSNENMNSTQKFLTFALQSAGQVAIAMLTTDMFQAEGESKVQLPGIFGKAVKHLGPVAGPIAFAAMTALLGGLMAVATSKVSKSKSQISQVTGASVSAGRLSTGMLTYAKGNVNEFTDPSTLTPGQQYNVDGADGHTYRARYMGGNPTTHLTNGPEFHLVGERGREAIIDANTTRKLQMDDTGIWNAIQTLYNGGSVRSVRRGGMHNFATGNLDDFDDVAAVGVTGTDGSTLETADVVSSLQASLDRNSDVLERAMREGIKGVFDIHGRGGLIDSYDRGKKEAKRHGEKY